MKESPNKRWEPLEAAVPRDVFLAEVRSWAERLEVQPREVHVRAMRRKWGSCSTNGRVTFDVDLLRQHSDFRRRVIVEELLHLRVPNHGKLFKALLRTYLAPEENAARCYTRNPMDPASRGHTQTRHQGLRSKLLKSSRGRRRL